MPFFLCNFVLINAFHDYSWFSVLDMRHFLLRSQVQLPAQKWQRCEIGGCRSGAPNASEPPRGVQTSLCVFQDTPRCSWARSEKEVIAAVDRVLFLKSGSDDLCHKTGSFENNKETCQIKKTTVNSFKQQHIYFYLFILPYCTQ